MQTDAAVEIERLSIPLWMIAGGVNTGLIAMVCWVVAALLAAILFASMIVQTWKATSQATLK